MQPPVVMWFKVYSAAMAVLYLLTTIFGIVLLFVPPELLEMEKAETVLIGAICAGMGLPFAGAFGAALFLPRKPWVWIYDIVLIAVGFGSCCILPFSVAMLIFWIKPETRAWFGRM
jgi:hypothetical protein